MEIHNNYFGPVQFLWATLDLHKQHPPCQSNLIDMTTQNSTNYKSTKLSLHTGTVVQI